MTQTLNLSLPKELVAKLDEQAKRDFSSRSEFIRKAIINQLNAQAETADDKEVMDLAKEMLNKYSSDFTNLSKR